MKTPMEIARETLGADALAGVGYEKYLPYMVRAIEADRAQRFNLEGGVINSPAWPDGCPMTLNELPNGDNVPGHVDCSKAQRAADIATLAAAAANYAEHILENIESMRADDEDRITDQAERDEIMAAINRLTGTKEA